MKKYIKNIVPVAALLLTMGTTTSCVGDLDVTPINPNIQTNLNIDGLFNKCYANFAMAGNGGANGDCDIDVLMVVHLVLYARHSMQTSSQPMKLSAVGVMMV